jgi:hypothetical protein
MSPKQRTLYWREWAKVLHAKGWITLSRAEQDAFRHQVHKQTLGADKSSSSMDNKDLDLILSRFRILSFHGSLSDGIQLTPGPEDPGQRRRLEWVVNHELIPKLGQPYVTKILQERFSSKAVSHLTTTELEQLRYTLTSRLRHKQHNQAA